MKRFKIVQHWVSPELCMFRVYERKYLFFWDWLTSYSEIEMCNHYIASILERGERVRLKEKNTPADTVVCYV